MVSLLWFGILFISILLFGIFICLGFKLMVCNISSCILLYYCDNNVIFYIIKLERKVILILIIVAFSGCIITDFEGRVSLADSALSSGSRFFTAFQVATNPTTTTTTSQVFASCRKQTKVLNHPPTGLSARGKNAH